jgi:hypothetical protein
MQTHDDLPHLNTAAGELISVANERAKKYIPLANSKIARELLILRAAHDVLLLGIRT